MVEREIERRATGEEFKVLKKITIGGHVPIHANDEVLIVEGTACVQAEVESVHKNGIKVNSPFLKNGVFFNGQEIDALYCPHYND